MRRPRCDERLRAETEASPPSTRTLAPGSVGVVLTAGIVSLAASVVVGAITLTIAAVTSPAARTAGRRTRTAMALSDAEEEQRARPAEARELPRWMLVLAMLCGGGFVLGLLLVMIGSMT